MRVSALPKMLLGKRQPGDLFDRRVVMHPAEYDAFREAGLTSPEAFLEIPGEIVSGHPDRHVMRVLLGDGRIAILKREHRIRWKERFRNWQANFGLASKSVREGRILQAIEERNLPGPRWLAFGESGDGRAFLLLEEAAGAVDLRRAWPQVDCPESLAIKLGRTCGELHEAGVDHPDLYAKHFLIEPSTLAITLIDWQRVTVGRKVSWPSRARALAALCATLPPFEASAGNGLNHLFLWAYLRVVECNQSAPSPDVATLSHWVDRESARMSQRNNVREQRQPPLSQSSQRLVWLEGEALCAIPEVAADLDPPKVRKMLYDPARNANLLAIAGGRTARLEVGVYDSLFGRCWAWLCRKAWRSTELRKARLLFHLERHHVSAPKLLAYGQRCGAIQSKAFVLTETVDATPLPLALRDADEDTRFLLLQRLADVLGRLHEAGCQVKSKECFAVKDVDGFPSITVLNPDELIFHKHLTDRRKKSDRQRFAQSMINECSRDEIQTFLDRLAESS